ncbi:MAG: PIN domain-containing protein [Acidobacteriota bacterium]
MKAITDTGFLVACVARRDLHHKWASELARRLDEPLLTCDAVLAETAFHLESAEIVFEMIQSGLVRPAFDIAAHIPRLAELAARYRDHKPDVADLCLIRMSELHPKLPVITTDVKDFRVYRRNRREVIPLIVPGDIQ